MTSQRLIELLTERSAKRLGQSEDFQKQLDQISKYVENKELKSVSLNEAKFMARRERLNADKATERADMEQVDANGIKRDFYLDEVLQITSDYAALLNKRRTTGQITKLGRSTRSQP